MHSHSLTIEETQSHRKAREAPRDVRHSQLPFVAFGRDRYPGVHQRVKGTPEESPHISYPTSGESMPHSISQRDFRVEVRLICHILQSVFLARREDSILKIGN